MYYTGVSRELDNKTDSKLNVGLCESNWSGLQEIPQLNYSMEYVTTHLQEIPQRIRWGS